MMLILLSNSGCPVLPFGAVNSKNRFEFLDAVACRCAASLREAAVQARSGGKELIGRRVKRGMEFDVIVEVKAKPHGSSESKVIFRQVIGILVFLPKSTKPVWNDDMRNPATTVSKSLNTPEHLVELTFDAPKKWAAVCNDINPIHMFSLAAKLFGFPGKIAHGNHVVAIVIEKLQGSPSSEEVGQLVWESKRPSFVEVTFKRPMVLPISLKMKFELASGSGGRSSSCFEVVRSDKTYIEGTWDVL